MQKGRKAAFAAVVFIVCCVVLGTVFANVMAKGGKTAADRKISLKIDSKTVTKKHTK